MRIQSLLATTKVFPLFDGNQSKPPGKRPAAQAQHKRSTCSPTLQVVLRCKVQLFIQVGAQGNKHFSHHCWVDVLLKIANCEKLSFKLCGMHSNNIGHRDSLFKGRTAKVKPFESASRFQQVFATRVVHKQVQILRLSSCGSKRPKNFKQFKGKGRRDI